MAPEPEVLKRRRSRPGNWWAAAPAPAQVDPQRQVRDATSKIKHPERSYPAVVGIEGKEKNKKAKAAEGQDDDRHGAPTANRGELAKTTTISQQAEGSHAETMKDRLAKRKRKRPSEFWVVQDNEEGAAAAPAPAPTARRILNATQPAVTQEADVSLHHRRGLRQNGKARIQNSAGSSKDHLERQTHASPSAADLDPLVQPVITANHNPGRKGRGLPSNTEPSNVVNSTKTKTRKSLQKPMIPEPEVVTASSSFGRARTKDTGRGKPLKAVAASAPHSPKTRRTRVSDTGRETGSNISTRHTAGGKKVSGTSAKGLQKGGSLNNAEEEPHTMKRRRVDMNLELVQNGPVQAKKVPPYQHLVAVTCRVPRGTIAKWEPLSTESIERITHLLQGIERPVVMRLHDERKRGQASTAVHVVTRKLVKRISKGLPFPPGLRRQREEDLDFEQVLNHNRALDAQLTPALHANELLEAELKDEKAFLESERANLAVLEANAKSESLSRKQAGRKVHALLQPENVKGDLGEDLGLATENKTWLGSLSSCKDEGLQALIQEVSGHVESMRGNVNQIQGISQAMVKGKATVQGTLFKELERKQYEAVVLGNT